MKFDLFTMPKSLLVSEPLHAKSVISRPLRAVVPTDHLLDRMLAAPLIDDLVNLILGVLVSHDILLCSELPRARKTKARKQSYCKLMGYSSPCSQWDSGVCWANLAILSLRD